MPPTEPLVKPDSTSMENHAKLHQKQDPSISWVWFFPILALLATSWFFWQKWTSYGPEVVIQFEEAPGIQSNKTLLFYRGVVSGKVTDVRLDNHLRKALVTIRLRNFATQLAQSGTLYWIDQPVISLAKTSGLSSLIQGNSIQARLGPGPARRYFVGLEHAPLHPLEPPGLLLKLTSNDLPNLEEGSPITYRGITIGGVQAKGIDAKGTPYAMAAIEQQYVHLVKENSTFWAISSSSCHLGPSGLDFEIGSLKDMLLGSVAVDNFVPSERTATNGSTFPLYPNRSAVPAPGDSLKLFLHASNIPTIMEGSPILYHGIKVGKVVLKTIDSHQEAQLTVLIEKKYCDLLSSNIRFWRVPATSLEAGPGILQLKIESLTSLLEGAIAFEPVGDKGTPLSGEESFELFASAKIAHLNPEPLIITFTEGQGLLAGETQLRFRGIPIGLVGEISVRQDHIQVTAYLKPGYEFLRRPEKTFTIIHTKLGFDGLTGLETLVSGVYIDCELKQRQKKPLHQFFGKIFRTGRNY